MERPRFSEQGEMEGYNYLFLPTSKYVEKRLRPGMVAELSNVVDHIAYYQALQPLNTNNIFIAGKPYKIDVDIVSAGTLDTSQPLTAYCMLQQRVRGATARRLNEIVLQKRDAGQPWKLVSAHLETSVGDKLLREGGRSLMHKRVIQIADTGHNSYSISDQRYFQGVLRTARGEQWTSIEANDRGEAQRELEIRRHPTMDIRFATGFPSDASTVRWVYNMPHFAEVYVDFPRERTSEEQDPQAISVHNQRFLKEPYAGGDGLVLSNGSMEIHPFDTRSYWRTTKDILRTAEMSMADLSSQSSLKAFTDRKIEDAFFTLDTDEKKQAVLRRALQPK